METTIKTFYNFLRAYGGEEFVDSFNYNVEHYHRYQHVQHFLNETRVAGWLNNAFPFHRPAYTTVCDHWEYMSSAWIRYSDLISMEDRFIAKAILNMFDTDDNIALISGGDVIADLEYLRDSNMSSLELASAATMALYFLHNKAEFYEVLGSTSRGTFTGTVLARSDTEFKTLISMLENSGITDVAIHKRKPSSIAHAKYKINGVKITGTQYQTGMYTKADVAGISSEDFAKVIKRKVDSVSIINPSKELIMLVTRYFNRGYSCSTVRNTTSYFRAKMEDIYTSASGYGLYRRPRVDYIEAQRVYTVTQRGFEVYEPDMLATNVTITNDVVGPLDSVTDPPDGELPITYTDSSDLTSAGYVRTEGTTPSWGRGSVSGL